MRKRSTVNGELRVDDEYGDAYYDEEVVGGLLGNNNQALEQQNLLGNYTPSDVQPNGLPGLYSNKPRLDPKMLITPSGANGGFPQPTPDMRAQFQEQEDEFDPISPILR